MQSGGIALPNDVAINVPNNGYSISLKELSGNDVCGGHYSQNGGSNCEEGFLTIAKSDGTVFNNKDLAGGRHSQEY